MIPEHVRERYPCEVDLLCEHKNMTAKGAIIVFHKLSHQSGLVLDGIFQAHSASAGFGIHLRTPVPPQLLDMRPIGTSPPSAS